MGDLTCRMHQLHQFCQSVKLGFAACPACSIYQVEGHRGVPFDGVAMNAVQRKVWGPGCLTWGFEFMTKHQGLLTSTSDLLCLASSSQ